MGAPGLDFETWEVQIHVVVVPVELREQDSQRILKSDPEGGKHSAARLEEALQRGETLRLLATKPRLLRRDHYRCRACAKEGDEVTLAVQPIQPESSNVEEMLTLCARCQDLVERWDIDRRFHHKSDRLRRPRSRRGNQCD